MKNCTLVVSTITKDVPNVPLAPANLTLTPSMTDQIKMSTVKDVMPGSLGLQDLEELCQSKAAAVVYFILMSTMLQLLDG